MSIYTDCSQALQRILRGEDAGREVRIATHGGHVFTELDVMIEAAEDDWDDVRVNAAKRRANEILGTYYRASGVHRYGPVPFNGVVDYARIAASIVYGGEGSPKEWETPNGSFGQIRYADDPLKGTGRRLHSNRDDLTQWPQPAEEPDYKQRVLILEAALAARDQLIGELRKAVGSGQMIDDLAQRVEAIERSL